MAELGALANQVPDQVAALGPLGPLYFYGIFVLVATVLLPVTPLIFASGALFGPQIGFCVTLAAVFTTSALSFMLAQTLLKQQVEGLVASNEFLQKVNAAVGQNGFWIVFLLRLSPLLPFAMSNYVLGLTSVGFGEFLVGTTLGYAPWIAVMVSSSAAAMDFMDGGAPWYDYAGAAVFTVGVVAFISSVANEALEEAAGCELDDSPEGLQCRVEDIDGEPTVV